MNLDMPEVQYAHGRLVSDSNRLTGFGSDLNGATVATLDHIGLASIVEVLRHQAEVQPAATAFIHLLDGEENEQAIGYGELWQRVQALAHGLQPFEPQGKRVLMLFETGIDYITGLLGTLLADATAIPSFPPIGSRALDRLATIAADAQPDLVLTNQRFSRLRERVLAVLPRDRAAPAWVDMDCIALEPVVQVHFPAVSPERVALIQYTSGSTSEPKGVLLTHANLMSNCRSASIWMGGRRQRVGCSWLPPYHDMGLMGGILQPIYEGFPTVLLAPAHFVQRPWRWLSALSRYRATVTIAPNFAFDLCVESVSGEELSALDLSAVEEIYCGAEPVRQSTLDRFAAHFSPVGFAARAFGPCYGLAEATVFVSGKPVDSAPVVLQVCRDQLALGQLSPVAPSAPRAVTLVSSGRVAPGHRLVIVDPQSETPVEDGGVGEIWVQGGNVGAGYWGKDAQSSASFHARLAGVSGRFMRTGDLGALREGELYVTGRLKDLIIIAGRNLYPQDLELCVQEAEPRLRSNGVVALGIDDGQLERLAIVAEIKRNEKLDEVALEEVRRRITAALVATYGVSPSHIHFGPVGSIPLTTSGKPQRQATKRSLLAGSLASYARQSR